MKMGKNVNRKTDFEKLVQAETHYVTFQKIYTDLLTVRY